VRRLGLDGLSHQRGLWKSLYPGPIAQAALPTALEWVAGTLHTGFCEKTGAQEDKEQQQVGGSRI